MALLGRAPPGVGEIMDLSVIILELNTRDLLRECLTSLEQSGIKHPSSSYSVEVIVADNGSNDGSVEMVKSNFPWVKLIENRRNLGFSKGNNAALPYASGRYVLFLNSDTQVFRETLTEMIRFMDKNPEIGASTCYLELKRIGGLDFNSHRGFPTPFSALTYFSGLHKIFPRSKLFGGYYQTYKDLSVTHEVDVIEGAFMVVRREAAEKVAFSPNVWWDEDFFFYGEDIDFCYRIKQVGYKIYYYPKVKTIHYKGATHGFNKQGVAELSDEDRQKLVKATTAAMKIFYQKHYAAKYHPLVTWLVFTAITVLSRFRSLKRGI